MSAAATRLFPTSPLKPNVLQPSFVANNVAFAGTNPAVNVLKPVVVTAARADSTAGSENNNNGIGSGGNSIGKSGKRKRKAGSSASGGGGGSKKKASSQPVELPPDFQKHHHSVKKFQTASVTRRNARERNRVKQVNCGFSTLRNHIPHLKNKTSKVDTLRAAVEYIQALRHLVGEDIGEVGYDGPVLITDTPPKENNDSKTIDDSISSSSPPPRSASSQSGEINPMVYQLPPIQISEFLHPLPQQDPSPPGSDSSSSSSTSNKSNSAAEPADSTIGFAGVNQHQDQWWQQQSGGENPN